MTDKIYGTADRDDPEFKKFLEGYVEISRSITPTETTKTLVRKTDKDYYLDIIKRNALVVQYLPAFMGVPKTYRVGTMVSTLNKKTGRCRGSILEHNMFRCGPEYGGNYVGCWVCKVDFGHNCEYHIRNDLTGPGIQGRRI